MASTPISPALMSHLKLGMQHLHAGSVQQADAEFRQALKLDANNVQANYACALASYQLNHLVEAEQFLRRVIQLQPHFILRSIRWASHYAQRERTQKASPHLNRRLRSRAIMPRPHLIWRWPLQIRMNAAINETRQSIYIAVYWS